MHRYLSILNRNTQLSIQILVYRDMGWIKVCEANSLSDGELIGFDHNSKRILIAKAHDKIYATDGICTHEYANLFSTGFLNEGEKTVTCPLHLSVFKLDDGVPQNPPAETPLKKHTIQKLR